MVGWGGGWSWVGAGWVSEQLMRGRELVGEVEAVDLLGVVMYVVDVIEVWLIRQRCWEKMERR